MSGAGVSKINALAKDVRDCVVLYIWTCVRSLADMQIANEILLRAISGMSGLRMGGF